jgi:hypothetical protein
MRISTALDHVENGTMTLPEFQRGYVWNRSQVRGLMSSLYREYPVGGLLIWTTEIEPGMRRDDTTDGGVVNLLLDGQQRITSLYGVMRGRPPRFFQGDPRSFTDLFFNVRDESFEFYGPVKMRDDPFWISVSELFQNGPEGILESLGVEGSELMQCTNRLFRLMGIRDRDIWVDEITGRDRTIDEVVEIFNRVNSGGTKLSKGDLALARVSADRPAARNELREMLSKWEAAGFHFNLEWLLRLVTTIATRQAQFSSLRDVDADAFGEATGKARKAVDFLLNLVSDRLGLDHDRVLGGRYSFAALAPLVTDLGGIIEDVDLQNQLLFWYIHTFMWGRYSGSTESVLQRDLEALRVGGVDGLIQELSRERGTLEVRPEDFDSSSVGSRLYPVLYMLTRVYGARDLDTGMELRANLLGKESALHVHHLFPKARLYEAGFGRTEANAIANFAFLTASSNLSVGARFPHEYLAALEHKNPGVLESQWVPRDPDLWVIDRYGDFLRERRKLMSDATNQFLSALREGRQIAPKLTPGPVESVAVTDDGDEPELDRITRIADELGLVEPQVHYEIVDAESGEVLAFADVVWPEGVQPELSDPVAFLLESDREMEERLNELGYRFFTELEKLVWYLESLVGTDIDGDGSTGEPAPLEEEELEQAVGAARWNRESFLQHLANQRGATEADLARRILDWYDDRGLEIFWGRGSRNGSATPKLIRDGLTYNLMSMWTDGGIQVQFSSMNLPPFDRLQTRREFANRLEALNEAVTMSDEQLLSTWPSVKLHQLTNPERLNQFLDAWDWYLDRIDDRKAARGGSDFTERSVEETDSTSDDDAALESRFHSAMAQIYTRAKSEAGYNATRYLQMVAEMGGLVTAKQLLHSSGVSEGFTHLWERGRLDLSVEALILSSEWEPLFTSDERRVARDRLESYGFNIGE